MLEHEFASSIGTMSVLHEWQQPFGVTLASDSAGFLIILLVLSGGGDDDKIAFAGRY